MNISAKAAAVMSSREFNQDTARAKRIARNGPVVITDRGKPSHVLMTMQEFEKLENIGPGPVKPKNLAEALADPRPEADFEWEAPKLSGFALKIPDLD